MANREQHVLRNFCSLLTHDHCQALRYLASASQHTKPASTPIETGSLSIFNRIRRSQVIQPSIECSSGEPQSHPSLDLADTVGPLESLKRVEKFICVNAVDTAKLLRAVRSTLLEEACEGGLKALLDEQYVCWHSCAKCVLMV